MLESQEYRAAYLFGSLRRGLLVNKSGASSDWATRFVTLLYDRAYVAPPIICITALNGLGICVAKDSWCSAQRRLSIVEPMGGQRASLQLSCQWKAELQFPISGCAEIRNPSPYLLRPTILALVIYKRLLNSRLLRIQ